MGVDVMPVYARVALTLSEAAEVASVDRRFLRWRAQVWDELAVHWLTEDSWLAIVREAEFQPWLAAFNAAGRPSDGRGLTYMPTDNPIAYSFVSCSLRDAAARTGVSEKTLLRAIEQGYLAAHRAGEKQGRWLLRAEDLDAWVKSLPTERRDERWSRY